MRTSEEIYHRVRWDARFDAARFVLGVNIRGAEPKRVPLPSFVPGGDIPWHRILFIEADGEVVWDRAAGVDRLDATDAGRARARQLLNAPYFTQRTPEPAPSHLAAASLRVLTWNTLWDRYDADQIYTARRRPLLLQALEAADADVIALQEVEAELLAQLRGAAWVRSGYTLCGRRSDVDAYGLVLLSRLPVREAAWHPFAPHKAVAAITVESAGGPVAVLNTHLSSDHSTDGAGRREAELIELAQGLAGIDADVILVGDFNDGTAGPATALRLRDAWTEVRGAADQTPTFDPGANPLAAISSLTGRASRLDRVLLRGVLRARTAALIGDAPVDSLFLSDHAGVLVDVDLHPMTAGLDVAPTARTALAWLPPEDPAVQRIRVTHDPQVGRWPAHVNVLYGFVPEAQFEAAAGLIADAVRRTAPFDSHLSGVRSFPHRSDATVWLDPAATDREAWVALHGTVCERFPRCVGRSEGYVPHLTLGRTQDVGRFVAEVAPQLAARRVPVTELVLLSRRADEPMRARARVALGTGEVTWLDQVAAELPTVDRSDLAPLVTVVREALGRDGAVVHVTGSRRLGCARPGADLDLVAAVPGAPDLDAIAARLPVVRHVVGARVPGLRLRLDGFDVDLAIVGTGAVDPVDAVTRRADLGADAAIALSAVSDAEAVLAAVSDREAPFAQLAVEVKAWARVRGLDSAPFGGVPGLAWTVLAALTVRAEDESPSELRRRFFATWAAWDWNSPITVDGPLGPDGPAMSIFTPTDPVRLLTAQVGPGFRDLVAEELYRAWEIVESSEEPWGDLLAPPPLHRRHAAWAVVRVPSEDDVGRVRGRIRGLLTALEEAGHTDVHGWPRPYDGGLSFAIGLGRTPPSADRLTELARPWRRSQGGVDVSWLDGGAVPTLN